MPADHNVVALVGRLTRDPEQRNVGETTVLAGRLAFTRREKRGDEWGDASNYVDVTLGWGNRADTLARMLTKGSRIAITGSLRWREWETKDGDKRQTIDVDARDVQLLNSKDETDALRSSGGGPDMPVDDPGPRVAENLDEPPF